MRSLFVLLVMFVSNVCEAQVPPPFPPSHNGPRIGFGMASQSTGGLFQNGTDLLIGPYFGWHWEAPVHWQVSIMPEVLWVTKGSVVRDQALGVRERNTYHYLEVPLLVKVSTDKEKDGMFLLAGPSMGYYVNGRYQKWLNGEKNTDIKYDLKDSDRRFQFSLLLGLGMDGDRWSFDVRAQTSLTPFQPIVNVQNVVYALTIAYRLGGRKPEPVREEE